MNNHAIFVVELFDTTDDKVIEKLTNYFIELQSSDEKDPWVKIIDKSHAKASIVEYTQEMIDTINKMKKDTVEKDHPMILFGIPSYPSDGIKNFIDSNNLDIDIYRYVIYGELSIGSVVIRPTGSVEKLLERKAKYRKYDMWITACIRCLKYK